MIIDGDDELVGRQALKLISSHYQKGKNWIVYTNFWTSLYEVGTSIRISKRYLRNNSRYRKKPRHFMGPIRTFYTQLFRLIKDRDHKFDNGTFFDTMYD